MVSTGRFGIVPRLLDRRADGSGDAGQLGVLRPLACVLALPLVHGWKRDALVVPTLYLAAFVWETRLVGEPSITRQLLLGALLVVMMLARPQGLIGRARVERV